MKYPDSWTSRLQKQFPGEYPILASALQEEAPVSLRLNPAKRGCQFPLSDPVAWAKEAFYLDARPFFTSDPLFHAGTYYVQEASSMLIEPVFIQLGLDKGKRLILDACAAPGGKSSHILSLMNDESALLANEVVRKRYQVLQETTMKWGYPQMLLSQLRMGQLAKLGPVFDLVLVDAPCSGEGLFRKDRNAIREWNPQHAASCALRQRSILDDAARLVKAGGFLIYSTCTFNPEENEKNAAYITDKTGLKSIAVPALESFGCLRVLSQNTTSYQALPSRVRGEGFFISCFQNDETNLSATDWKRKPVRYQIPEESNPLVGMIDSRYREHLYKDQDLRLFFLNPIMSELTDRLDRHLLPFQLHMLGELKRMKPIPSHFLAMSQLLKKDHPSFHLNHREALHFLKKETFPIDLQRSGWHTVFYGVVRLGWLKAIQNKRWNNYYPMSYRIRTSLSKLTGDI